MKQTARQRERQQMMEDRQIERSLIECHDIPRHVLRSELALDDDPDLAAYNEDLYA